MPIASGCMTNVGGRGFQVAFKFGLTGAKVFTLGCIQQLDVTPLQHKMYVFKCPRPPGTAWILTYCATDSP